MPRRKSDSCAAILAAVSVAFPYTNNLLGMYMRRRTPITEARMYKSPATLAFLLSEVMCPRIKMYQYIRVRPRESSGRLQCWLIVVDNSSYHSFIPVNTSASETCEMGIYRQLRFWKGLAAQIGMSSRGLVCRRGTPQSVTTCRSEQRGGGALPGVSDRCRARQ